MCAYVCIPTHTHTHIHTHSHTQRRNSRLHADAAMHAADAGLLICSYIPMLAYIYICGPHICTDAGLHIYMWAKYVYVEYIYVCGLHIYMWAKYMYVEYIYVCGIHICMWATYM